MKLRIDTSGTTFVCTRAPEPRTAFDTGQPKIDQATGLPLWSVQLMALDSSGGEVIAVTVAGDPKITVGQPVQVEGLVALPWSQAGRSGVAFRAEAIRATGAPLTGVVAAPKGNTAAGTPSNPGKPAA
jgi:type IV secretory pathway TrbL component